jgi:hypothetical protein
LNHEQRAEDEQGQQDRDGPPQFVLPNEPDEIATEREFIVET